MLAVQATYPLAPATNCTLQCLPPPNLHTRALNYPRRAKTNTTKAMLKYAMRVCSTAHTSGLF